MLYYSLNNPSLKCSFEEATIRGQAQDKGLFFPETIPLLSKRLITEIESYTKEEIAFQVIHPYVEDAIPQKVLKDIIAATINFPFPLISVNDRIYALELFHGPTLAFKDVGARFMSRCLGYFVRHTSRKVTVLVATSGDTGGAVANGFYDVEGINVVILYPSGKVSKVQEAQLTTLGKNITALEIAGNFDDCQHLVKQAFADKALSERLFLTSANSINIARWLPQQLYYFFAWQQWPFKDAAPVIAVPSGNFGNICAGLLAFKSGLPVRRFLAACNANDVVPSYMADGIYQPRKAVATMSNAMDVGDPSNFIRILELFGKDPVALSDILGSKSVSDAATRETIKKVYAQYNYVLDPHGAVGYAVLEQYLNGHPSHKGYFLETAHPVKFHDTIDSIIGQTNAGLVADYMNKSKHSIKMNADYAILKDFLLSANA